MKRLLFAALVTLSIACGDLKDAAPTPQNDTPAPVPSGSAPSASSPSQPSTSSAGTTVRQTRTVTDVVSNLKSAYLVAVDDTQLFFNDGSSIYHCPKDDCSAPALITSRATTDSLLVTHAAAYWFDIDGRLITASEYDYAPTPLVEGTANMHGLATDGDLLFWLDGAALEACTRTACVAENVAQNVTAARLTASEGTVFGLDVTLNELFAAEVGTPLRAYETGMSSEPFAVGSHLFWFEDGAVRMGTLASAAAAPAIGGKNDAYRSLISDGTAVYWRTDDAIVLARTDLGGALPIVTGETFAEESRLAMDRDSLYWATPTGIRRLAL